MNNKLRLCLVVPTHKEDDKYWSGTHATLYRLLSKRDDIDLFVVEYPYRETFLWRMIYSKIVKFVYTWSSPQDFVIRPLVNRLLSAKLNNLPENIDYLLFPGTPCSIQTQEIKGKLCVYTDCLMSDLNRYRPYRPFKMISSLYYKYNMKKDLSACSILFTQNEWSKQRFCEFANIPEKRVHNVHFGINVSASSEEKDYSKKLMLIVLRKGTENTKGLSLLLEAMPLIRKSMPDAELAVVGTDKGIDVEGVTCYYNQPRSITVELFKKSTLYVMPARNEPNGITYLEALANRTPIVGLNRFSFPEFCNNGEFGFIVKKPTPQELSKVIVDAYSNSNRLAVMGKNGQDYVNKTFSWASTVDAIVRIMKESL